MFLDMYIDKVVKYESQEDESKFPGVYQRHFVTSVKLINLTELLFEAHKSDQMILMNQYSISKAG